MTWRYSQSTGMLMHDGHYVGRGYSGAQPDGYNIRKWKG